MSIYTIYRSAYHNNGGPTKTDKFPICFSTLKPYLAISLQHLSIIESGSVHSVPLFERFIYNRSANLYSSYQIMEGLTGISYFQEMDTETEGYYVSWMFLFHKEHKWEKREKISIMMMPVVPSEFIDLESLSVFEHHHNISIIKDYLEIWINPQFRNIHPYLYRKIADNIFPLLELEQIPIIRKPEQQMWEKAIIKYQKPNFSSIEEATSYGEQLYKMNF